MKVAGKKLYKKLFININFALSKSLRIIPLLQFSSPINFFRSPINLLNKNCGKLGPNCNLKSWFIEQTNRPGLQYQDINLNMRTKNVNACYINFEILLMRGRHRIFWRGMPIFFLLSSCSISKCWWSWLCIWLNSIIVFSIQCYFQGRGPYSEILMGGGRGTSSEFFYKIDCGIGQQRKIIFTSWAKLRMVIYEEKL